MTDIVPAVVRSRMMSGIRSTNTKPEMVLRKGLHAQGFRFRLHDRKLPGSPDIVLSKYRAVLFANGCFWHGHDCHLFRLPATRTDFWLNKINSNRDRDARTYGLLRDQGWRVGVVWECALKGRTRLPYENVIDMCSEWMRSDEAALEIRGL
jgi:DNA mismatch endonuclease (patch repair protein)